MLPVSTMPDDALETRALAILRSEGRASFRFQAVAASRGVEICRDRGRLLVLAPTGSGKTLISQLLVALLAEADRDRFPRILVVVPSRGLVEQHYASAGWLRNRVGLALHMLTADTPLILAKATLESRGVVFTTPITLARRIATIPGGLEKLGTFDCAIFDEIDTYLSVDDLAERRDTFPALQRCLDAQLPVIGFTGTNLDGSQAKEWSHRSFAELKADVPKRWLPYTPVVFVGVTDPTVVDRDAWIRDEMGLCFGQLTDEFGPISFHDVKVLARGHHPQAIRILSLCFERLALFESFGSSDQKIKIVLSNAASGTSLILTRFRRSAEAISTRLRQAGIDASFAHGGLDRVDLARVLEDFRQAQPTDTKALVLTRELGGRGLDFPLASRVVLFSPRSSYQTVAQELARIRSRMSDQKHALIVYYDKTEERAKAYRLATHLGTQVYEGKKLFSVDDAPTDTYVMSAIERRLARFEESIPEYNMVAEAGLGSR